MKNGLKILLLIGTRPEIIKNFSVVQALSEQKLCYQIVYTNQHNDYPMNKLIFDELSYNPDKVLLKKFRLGASIDALINYIKKENFGLIIVNGDTTTSLIGTIAGIHTDIQIAHIEAGLRSYDKHMYEERNRIFADFSAHFLFAYTKYQAELLNSTKGLRGRIFNVGNTTVDILNANIRYITKLSSRFLKEYGDFIFVTMHRKEFTDSKQRMNSFFETLQKINRETGLKIIFPVHPRTSFYIDQYRIKQGNKPEISIIRPVSFLESVSLQKAAKLILTDSGCIQEEACILNTPCITVRNNTERVETLLNNANMLAGFESDKIMKCVHVSLKKKRNFSRIYGKPGAGKRIVSILTKEMTSNLLH